MSDLIRRSDAIKAIEKMQYAYNGWANTFDKAQIIETIEDVPTIEPKRGEWIEADVIDIEDTCIEEIQTLKCSICGRIQTKPYLYYVDCDNFCPNCGADMREVRNE